MEGGGPGSVRTPISPTLLPGRPYPQPGLGWLGSWARALWGWQDGRTTKSRSEEEIRS